MNKLNERIAYYPIRSTIITSIESLKKEKP